MVAVPAATPVTVPDDAPIVATVTSLLVHVPEGTELVSVVLAPVHTVDMPNMGGNAACALSEKNTVRTIRLMYLIYSIVYKTSLG